MIQKFSALLSIVLLCAMHLSAQTKVTATTLAGTWQITHLKVEGEKVDVTNEEALIDFLLKGTLKERQKDSGLVSITLTTEDSAAVKVSVAFLAAFSKGQLVFNANKTFRFTMPKMKKVETGTWALNEKLQLITLIQTNSKTKSKGMVSESKGFKFVDGQLLMQMEKNKEEGFLFTKAK